MQTSAGPVTLSSNAFVNVSAGPTVTFQGGGPLTADYNGFFGPPGGTYSDNRTPAHDVVAADAKLSNPPNAVFDIGEYAIWQRSTSTAAVLSTYRGKYMPQAGSPLLGAGDPNVVSGNWIGAVGTGQADKFGSP
jgi:hypothetical protein